MVEFTTREHLEVDLSGCLNAAVLDYGDYVITVLEHCFKGIMVAIYEMVESPEETGLERCECRLMKIEEKVGFEDTGHGAAWAFGRLQ